MSGRPGRLLPLGGRTGPAASVLPAASGAKAARLSAARRAGFAVLPGWIVPCAEGRAALGAGLAALRAGQPAAARRAVLSCPTDPELTTELRAAVTSLGGRVVVRSSSPLEDDPRWAGAFSSVAEVGPDDAAAAMRSCWASAFAVDPVARLAACGLPAEALELGLLIQPEIRPAAGGVARVVSRAAAGRRARRDGLPSADRPAAGALGLAEVVVDGVAGHPGALLSGWADGACARVLIGAAGGPGTTRRAGRPGVPQPPEGPLAGLIGADLVTRVARLACDCARILGDAAIEWAACDDGTLWLLQTQAVAPAAAGSGPSRTASWPAGPACPPPAGQRPVPPLAGRAPLELLADRALMPLLAGQVQALGGRVRGRPAAAGQAAGRLVACRPHERPPAQCRDAILLVDQPVPALAPLLFAARGVIARAGAAGSHLAGVARSLAVPMVTGCHPEAVTGPGPHPDGWLAAIDGSTGEVALLPG